MAEPELTVVRVEDTCLVADSQDNGGIAIQEAIKYAKWKNATFDLVIDGSKPLVIHPDSRFEEVVDVWDRHRVSQPYYQ